MYEVAVNPLRLGELEGLAREVLSKVSGEIVDGKIDGVFWFLAVLRRAEDLRRRRATWRLRTSVVA